MSNVESNNLYSWCLSNNRELLNEWDYEKNYEDPSSFSKSSNKKVWWICKNNHSWYAVINSRTKGCGCPYCSGTRVLSGYNDLKTLNPKFLIELDNESNKQIDITKIGKGSRVKLWWICPKGHKYEASVSKRFNGTNCPICDNKKIISGINDLKTLNPKIIKEWNYDKNKIEGIDPTKITCGSHKKAWWICSKGHEYFSSIANKCKNRGCPVCSSKKIVIGYNDLVSQYPNIAKEWNYDKNEKGPEFYAPKSNKKVWWVCSEGHEFEQRICDRTAKNRGCRICAINRNAKMHSIPKSKEESLLYLYPEISKEWNYKRNTLTPDLILPKSNKKAWWICFKGHEWETTPNARTVKKTSCPICANHIIIPGENDLFTTHPHLRQEWDFYKNTVDPLTISYGSNIKVWWLCPKGHSYRSWINNKTNQKTECSKCIAERKTSLPEKIIFYYIKNHFSDAIENYKDLWLSHMELDIFIPSIKTAIEYDGKFWHKNLKNDFKKDDICLNNNIRLIRIREGNEDYDSSSIVIQTDKYSKDYLYLTSAIKNFLIY